MKFLLMLPVLLVVLGFRKLIGFIASVCAAHHTKKICGTEEIKPRKYPETCEEAVAYLTDPAMEPVKRYWKTKWRNVALIAAGLWDGILLFLGITLQIDGLWIPLVLLMALITFPMMMAWRSALKQVKAWSDASELEMTSPELLMAHARALDDCRAEYRYQAGSENDRAFRLICVVSSAIVLLLAVLQTNYYFHSRELEPGVWRVANYQYRVLEDDTVEIVRYTGLWKSARVPASIQGKPVSSIGPKAFSYERGDYTVFGRKDVEKIILPDSLRRIDSDAFAGCSKLGSLEIPSGVTVIGARAFAGCPLKELNLPPALEEIGDQAFEGCPLSSLAIPDSVTKMGDNPFARCWKLREISISPDHPLFCIRDGALCSRDGRLIFVPGFEEITDFRVPEGISRIDSYVFCDARSLKRVILPEGLTELGVYAFQYCTALREVELPDSLVSLGSYCFCYCKSLEELRLPEGLRAIGPYCFYHCEALREIRIPAGVKEIREGTFWGCRSLRSAEIPEGVTAIRYDAFADCDSLDSLVIPESVREFSAISPFDPQTVLIVTPGSPAEAYCRRAGLSWRYAEEP